MNGWIDGWMDECMDGIDRWMEGWMDGWMDGWMIGSGTHITVYTLYFVTFVNSRVLPYTSVSLH